MDSIFRALALSESDKLVISDEFLTETTFDLLISILSFRKHEVNPSHKSRDLEYVQKREIFENWRITNGQKPSPSRHSKDVGWSKPDPFSVEKFINSMYQLVLPSVIGRVGDNDPQAQSNSGKQERQYLIQTYSLFDILSSNTQKIDRGGNGESREVFTSKNVDRLPAPEYTLNMQNVLEAMELALDDLFEQYPSYKIDEHDLGAWMDTLSGTSEQTNKSPVQVYTSLYDYYLHNSSYADVYVVPRGAVNSLEIMLLYDFLVHMTRVVHMQRQQPSIFNKSEYIRRRLHRVRIVDKLIALLAHRVFLRMSSGAERAPIKALVLDRCGYNDGRQFADFLLRLGMTQLESLSICGMPLGLYEATALGMGLQDSSVKVLDINRTLGTGIQGISSILRAIRDLNLRALGLRGLRLSDVLILVLSDFMFNKDQVNLRELDISGNNFTTVGIYLLSKCLLNAKYIKTLCLADSIVEAGESTASWGEGYTYNAHQYGYNFDMQLRSNRISADRAQEIQKLNDMGRYLIKDFRTGHIHFWPVDVHCIANLIAYMTSKAIFLERLYLDGVSLDNECVRKLRGYLAEENGRLDVLGLSSTRLQMTQLEHIARALGPLRMSLRRTKEPLSKLDIRGNPDLFVTEYPEKQVAPRTPQRSSIVDRIFGSGKLIETPPVVTFPGRLPLRGLNSLLRERNKKLVIFIDTDVVNKTLFQSTFGNRYVNDTHVSYLQFGSAKNTTTIQKLPRGNVYDEQGIDPDDLEIV